MAAALVLVALGGRTRAAEPEADAVAAVDINLQSLASGLGSITSITNAGDSRIFLTTQNGRILVWSGGQILATPFLNLSPLISCCGERGLLSVAFHPQYLSNGLFFVYYTDVNGDIAIARYHCTNPATSNVADPSGVLLLTIPHPTNANHNGGQLQFGPVDGYLYFGTGDGGSGDDPPCNAQNDNVALGKMLRIDVDHDADASHHYSVPSTNPHYVAPGNPDDPFQLTWAKGLRNPFRFSFDSAAPHDLWIGDVGQGQWEEIDDEPSTSGGLNYGWRIYEGNNCRPQMVTGCSPPPPGCTTPPSSAYTYPVFVYDHSGSPVARCAIIGGYVYRGSQIAGLAGTYVYGDLCSGDLYGYNAGSTTHFTANPGTNQLQTFGQDSAGELYLATGGGSFYKIIPAETPTPTPTPTLTSTPPPTPTSPPILTPTPDPSLRRSPVPVDARRPRTRELTPRPPD
jgi:glucose/arabinose dehydrogenase